MKTIPIQVESALPETCAASELLALQVLDESMAPEFEPGHVVVIDGSAKLSAGSFVLVERLDGEVVTDLDEPTSEWLIRRWQPDAGSVVLESLNPEWPDEQCAMSTVRVHGVVVQRSGRRRRDRRNYR